jgi:glycosyltransferase involved in cell wall biosynthesis
MSEKPTALFLSPIYPDITGNGLAIRSGSLLRALAASHQVTLLTIPVQGNYRTNPPEELLCLCSQHKTAMCTLTATDISRHWYDRFKTENPPTWKQATPEYLQYLRSLCDDQSFDLLYVFRLYLTPFCDAFSTTRRVLDLDELDSKSMKRTAEVLRTSDQHKQAHQQQVEASAIEKNEAKSLATYQSISVSTAAERDTLLQRFRTLPPVTVIPNPCPEPTELSTTPSDSTFRFLFVGNFFHLPNLLAAQQISYHLLPQLQDVTARPLECLLAGAGDEGQLRQLDSIQGVHCYGRLDSITALQQIYARCNTALVPLQSGGGSRIKILEAFAYGLPVISTPIGAEGLEVQDGLQLRIAEWGPDFLQACLDSIDNPEPVEMISAGRDYLKLHHTPEVILGQMQQQLAAAY